MIKKGWDDKIAATALQVNTFPLFWSVACKHSFIKSEISVTLALHINDDRKLLMENIDAERPTRHAWPAHLTHLQCSAFRYAVSMGHCSHCDKMSQNEPFNKGTVLIATKTKPRGECFVVEPSWLGVLFGLR
jgi:hypothetical protein